MSISAQSVEVNRRLKNAACKVIVLAGLLAFLAPGPKAYCGVTPPDAVTDLTGMIGNGLGRLTLTWTSPGDDGLTGNLVSPSSYTIQYTTSPDFNGWSPHSLPAQPNFVYRVYRPTNAVAPYTVQTEDLTSLTIGATHYIRIWASDEVGNFSALSNGATSYMGGWVNTWNTSETNWTTSINWGDYDNDGDLDFASGNANGGFQIYQNNGNGTFTPASTLGGNFGRAFWGDYDRDGDLDVLLAREGATANLVYRNDGGNAFTLAWTSQETENTKFASWGDFDNDGDLDHLAANTGTFSRLYRNDGNSVFTLAWSTSDTDILGASFGDCDNDGYLDIATAKNNGGANNVYRNDGNGSFSLHWTAPSASYSYSAIWGDYDADGDMDLAFGNRGEASRVFSNDGSGSFTLAWTTPENTDVRGIFSWGDFDADGDLDLSVPMINIGGSRVYRYDGGNSFSKVWVNSAVSDYYTMTWGDFDNDGIMDLAAGSISAGVNVLKGMSLPVNTPPSAPSGGFSSVWVSTISHLRLSAAAATDAETSANGLNYEFSVSTYPVLDSTSWYIVSPTTGAGATPFMGNSSHGFKFGGNPGLLLSGLSADTSYYWRVRARDAQLKAGPWSALQSVFTGEANPSPVTSLTGIIGMGLGRIKLTWTSPGDDGFTGALVDGSSYTLQYTTDIAFNSWSPTAVYPAHVYRIHLATSGVNPYSVRDTYELTGLSIGSTWYIRLWTSDELGNMSSISNGATSYPNGWYVAAEASALRELTSVNWGDFDNDGDLDILTSNKTPSEPGNLVYRNLEGTTGGPSFLLTWSSQETDPSVDSSWGDFNNDGKPDFAIASLSAPNRVYVGDGAGSFALKWSSPQNGSAYSVSAGDLDGDGDQDLAFANSSSHAGACVLYENLGDGTFTELWLAPYAGDALDASLGDYDNDGDMDVFVGRNSRLYRNDGKGMFTNSWSANETNNIEEIRWGDYDNDGNLDIAIANVGGVHPNRVYSNSGSDSFATAWSSQDTSGSRSISWADFDNDGDLDQVVGKSSTGVQIIRNAGGNSFVMVMQFPELQDNETNIGDYDGDGDLDIILGADTGLVWGKLRILKNNRVEAGQAANPAPSAPSGGFYSNYFSTAAQLQLRWAAGSDAPTPAAGLHYDIQVATVSITDNTTFFIVSASSGAGFSPFMGNYSHGYVGAGIPGLNLTNVLDNTTYYWRVRTRDSGLRRSASWSAVQSTWVAFDTFSPGAVTSLTAMIGSDIGKIRLNWTSPGDNDFAGTLVAGSSYTIQYTTDIAFNSWSPTAVYPSHVFRMHLTTSGVNPGSVISTYELTGLTNGASYYIRIWTSDDLGNMSSISNGATSYMGGWVVSWQSAETNDNNRLSWGDYDNDGNLDVMVGNSQTAPRLYQNGGTGTFTLAWTGPDNSTYEFGDFDNDGDLDLLGGVSGAKKVLRNNGGNSFTTAWLSQEIENTGSPKWGDFDNDGDLDIVTISGDAGVSHRIYRNNGGANFTTLWTSQEQGVASDISLGDYDNDGDLDLAIAYRFPYSNRVYRNDGNGGFSIAWEAAVQNTYSITWGDIEGDGDLDLAVGIRSGFNKVYRNDGGGTFSILWTAGTGNDTRGHLSFGDFDNDGDLDLAVPTQNAPYTVYRFNGASDFVPVWISSQTGTVGEIYWGDFDGDGRMDLATGFTGQSTIILKSLGLSANAAPTAPSGGFSTMYVSSASQLQIRWGAGTDAETPAAGLNYDIQVSTHDITDATTFFIVSPSSGAGATPFMGNYSHGYVAAGVPGLNLTNVSDDTTYYWRVRTRDSGLRRSNSWSAVQSTFVASAHPANVRFFGFTTSSMSAQWDHTPGRSYTMSISSHASFSFVASSGTGDLNQSATGYAGLLPNASYFFKVKVSTHGDSNYSPSISTYTMPNIPATAVSTFTVALASITAVWQANSNPQGTLYIVDIATSSEYVGSKTSSQTYVTSVTSGGLTSNVFYHFRVRARNSLGADSVTSLYLGFKTLDSSNPGAVSDLTAMTGSEDGSIGLQWTLPGSDGYSGDLISGSEIRIRGSTSPITDFNTVFPVNYSVNLATVATAGAMQTHPITGLNPGTSYYFAVVTRDNSGNQGSWSVLLGANPASTATAADLAPNAPSVYTALPSTNVTESSLRINWNVATPPQWVQDISSYTVYRATFSFSSPAETYVAVATTVVHPTTFYSDSGLQAGVTYFYRVVAIDSGTYATGYFSSTNSSALSTEISTRTLFHGATSFLGVVASSTSIMWSWTDNSSNETGYRVFSSTDGQMSGDLAAGATYWPETGLSPNVSYTRFVRAFNSLAVSSPSILASSYTYAAIPEQPTLASNGQSGRLTFAVVADANIDGTQYTLAISSDNFTGPSTNYIRFSEGGVGGAIFWRDRDTWNGGAGTITGLSDSLIYYVKVKARNSDQVETAYGPVAAAQPQITETTPPAGISFLTALPGNLDGRINLSWTSPGDDGMTGVLNSALYRIRYSTAPFNFFSSTEANSIAFSTSGVSPATAVGTVITGLNPGSTYYFGVITRDDESNWSRWTKMGVYNLSNSTWAHDAVLTPPHSVTVASALESAITLSWTAPAAPSEVDDRSGYLLYKASWNFTSVSDFGVILATTVPHPYTTYIDTSLPETTYYYRLASVDLGDQGNGLYSAVLISTLSVAVTTTTLINAATGFAATSVAGTTIAWSWVDNSGRELFYQVFSTQGVQRSPDLAPGTTFWVETGLSPNINYARCVRVVDHSTITVNSASIEKYTLANAPGILPYSNVQANSLTASVSTQGNSSLTNYTFNLSRSSSFPDPLDFTLTFALNQFPFGPPFITLLPNTSYHVQVRARNQEGVNTDYTYLGATITLPSTLPAPILSSPSTGTVTALIEPGDNPVDTELSIAVSNDSFATQYFVQIDSTLAPTEFFQPKAQWNGGTVTIQGLNSNVTYQVRTRARNVLGVVNSFSSIASTATLAQTPAAPGHLQEFDSTLGNHVHLIIDAGGNSASTEYSMEYFTGGQWLQGDGTVGSSQVWKTAAQWTVSHATNTHAGLVGGASYSYRLQARNLNGLVTSLSTVTSFIAATFADSSLPTLASVSPSQTAVSALVNATVQLTFSEPVSAVSAAGKITLTGIKNNSGTAIASGIAGSISVSSNVLTFTPSANLSKGYEYQVDVASGIQDISGNPVTSSMTWSFRTACDIALTNIVSGSAYSIQFTPGAFGEDYGVSAANPQSTPREVDSASLARAISRGAGDGTLPTFLVSAAIVEINVYSAGGSGRMSVPRAPTTLTISYPDADDDGYVDGLSYPILAENLSIYFFDEISENFVKLPASSVDLRAKTVTVRLPHFSVFALFGAPSTSLSNAHAFPVPFMPSRGDTRITFTDLSGVATIKIYSVHGELLQTLEESDGDGQYPWDAKSSDGNELASGIYLYHIQSASDEKRGKFIIVR